MTSEYKTHNLNNVIYHHKSSNIPYLYKSEKGIKVIVEYDIQKTCKFIHLIKYMKLTEKELRE